LDHLAVLLDHVVQQQQHVTGDFVDPF